MTKVGSAVENPGSLFRIFLTIIAIGAMITYGWAQSGSAETIAATINLTKAAKVGNTELAAGQYKVTASGGQAKFQKGSKVVAQVPCTLKDLSYTSKTTQFETDDNGRITEIQVAGKTKAIEISS